jgi:hypothetical protein
VRARITRVHSDRSARERYRPPKAAWVVLALIAVAGVALVPRGDSSILLEDDFSGSGKDWLEDAAGSLRYEAGSYRIVVPSGSNVVESYADVREVGSMRIDVDASIVRGNGGVGVLCLSSLEAAQAGDLEANADSYAFYVSFADSGYAISRSGANSPLATSSDSPTPLGAGARISAECTRASSDGLTLRLSIGGHEVLEYIDDDGDGSFVGVGLSAFSYEGPVEAAFDDIRVVEPPREE